MVRFFSYPILAFNLLNSLLLFVVYILQTPVNFRLTIPLKDETVFILVIWSLQPPSTYTSLVPEAGLEVGCKNVFLIFPEYMFSYIFFPAIMFLHFRVFLQVSNQDLVRYFTSCSIWTTDGKEIICSAKWVIAWERNPLKLLLSLGYCWSSLHKLPQWVVAPLSLPWNKRSLNSQAVRVAI